MTEIALPASLDIACTAGLRDQLLALLEKGGQVTIHAGGVERVDTAGVQLLTAFLREARGRDVPVVLEGAGGALQDAARVLGLEEILL